MAIDLLFIHATGLLALTLNVIALVRSCEKSLRMQSGVAGVVWALNNLLLGAHTAAALSLVSAGRSATSAMTLDRSAALRRLACGGFALLTLAVALLTWHGWPSALLAVASMLSTYAVFYLRGGTLRWSMLFVSALWMVHAWSLDSWEQMAANIVTAVAAVVGARRAATERSSQALPRQGSLDWPFRSDELSPHDAPLRSADHHHRCRIRPRTAARLRRREVAPAGPGRLFAGRHRHRSCDAGLRR
jgi:hypothetical protein